MRIGILITYCRVCKATGEEPTWEGLYKFKNTYYI